MPYNRTDKLLTNETGVLPGSQYFISTKPYTSPHLLQYMYSCGHYFCVPGYEIRRDYYKYILLAYIMDGELLLEYDGKTYRAHRGDVVFIDCQNPHCYASGKKMEFIWIHVEGNIARQFCREINQKNGPLIQCAKNEEVKNGLLNMIDAYKKNEPPSTGETSSALYGMLCALYSSVMKTIKMSDNQLAMASIQYMRYNLVNDIGEADIAASLGLDTQEFRRLFTDSTGYGPQDYLIQLRIGLAQHFFVTSDTPVEQVMAQVGFTDLNAFEAAFIEVTGETPTAYRVGHSS